MKRAAIIVLLLAALTASCLERQTDIPTVVAGIVVDSQTRKTLAWVKVSVELKRDAVSGYGHDVKEWTTVAVAETEEDGRFAIDLSRYRGGDGKGKQGRTLRKITFEKDRYETLVKQPGEDWSRTELKIVPAQ
jgi:hypothetical protein